MIKIKRNKKGFTLIELLVVIAIIGLLATIVLVSLNNARVKARDAKRKVDLQAIAKAMEMYYYDLNKGTYIISGTGSNGCSCGWFNYEGGSYAKSVAHGIEEAGLMGKAPRDPLLKSDNQTPQYMKYQYGKGFFIYAKLENPSAEDVATYNSCPRRPGYGMNYAVGHQ